MTAELWLVDNSRKCVGTVGVVPAAGNYFAVQQAYKQRGNAIHCKPIQIHLKLKLFTKMPQIAEIQSAKSFSFEVIFR